MTENANSERIQEPITVSASSVFLAPSMKALPNPDGPVFPLTRDLLLRGCQAAAESPRRRIIQPVQRRQDDSVQRLINFLQPGTYVRPHVHPAPGQVELLHVLQGRIGFLVFHENGQIESVHDLSAGPLGLIDIEAGVWHCLVCLAPDTVITEAKQGPYDPQCDKTFAPWAPEEGDPAAPEFVRRFAACFAA